MQQVLDNKEYNTFIKGLITEANPLSYPEDSSVEEENFTLTRQGFRRRRLGLDAESGTAVDTGYSAAAVESIAVSVNRWRNVNGDASVSFTVVQIGIDLYFFDYFSDSVMSNPVNDGDALTLPSGSTNHPIHCVSINGKLVVTADSQVIYVLSYDDDTDEVSLERHGLLARDIWGIDDGFNSHQVGVDSASDADDLTSLKINDKHLYNLLNQGWGTEGVGLNPEDGSVIPTTVDSYLDIFVDTKNYYPSNAHVVYSGIDENADNVFNFDLVENSIIGSSLSPRGKYIIDVFWRDYSRKQAITGRSIENNYGLSSWGDGVSGDIRALEDDIDAETWTYDLTIPDDEAGSGVGIGAIGSYAGRVFYSGFSSERDGGDSLSPNLTSYVFYSQVVTSDDKIGKCYQKGDPTVEGEDLVATDGGSINIPEMSGVRALIPIGSSLAVIADNGVWEISGGEGGFSATDNEVKRVSDAGCVGYNSIVSAEDSIFYWAESGIYSISREQVSQSLVSTNITDSTIKTYYNQIDFKDKSNASGTYDSSERTVKWMFNDEEFVTNHKFNKQLNLDLTLEAFYVYSFNSLVGAKPPYIADVFTAPEFISYSGGSDKGDQIISRTKYLIIWPQDPADWHFHTAVLNNNELNDWADFDALEGVGVDSPAKLKAGYEMLGDTQRKKQVTYLTAHFKRTETGFSSGDGTEVVADNQSSCLITPSWDFSDHSNSGKIGNSFQAYRLSRDYIPSGTLDDFDYGHFVISTKNKIRGRGRVLSLTFESEPGKHCVIYGWGIVFSGNSSV